MPFYSVSKLKKLLKMNYPNDIEAIYPDAPVFKAKASKNEHTKRRGIVAGNKYTVQRSGIFNVERREEMTAVTGKFSDGYEGTELYFRYAVHDFLYILKK